MKEENISKEEVGPSWLESLLHYFPLYLFSFGGLIVFVGMQYQYQMDSSRTESMLESKLKEDIINSRVIDVNGDSKPDLYLGGKLYISTDQGMVPVEEYVNAGKKIERDKLEARTQLEIKALYDKVGGRK